MKIDFYSSERHYTDHIANIYLQLPEHVRGTFYGKDEGWEQAMLLTVPAHFGPPPRAKGLLFVSGYKDAINYVKTRRIALINHGTGQTYTENNSSFSNGIRHPAVELYLCPSTSDAEVVRKHHPASEAVVVGAPKLDPWHEEPMQGNGSVAISFHWPCKMLPETDWAYPHFQHVLKNLRQGYEVIGHGHPRVWPFLEEEYRLLGIHPVKEFTEVLGTASVYMADNSSTLMEFASTGRPVVFLSPPWYRREVHHGGRFWEWTEAGPDVTEPESLMEAIQEAREWDWRARQQVVDQVYDWCDGLATYRAVEALVDWANSYD